MIIVADTCSLLLLLRLNPEMLTNRKFGCCTTQEVRDEIFRTARFAEKYPWRVNFRNKIQAVPQADVNRAPGYADAIWAVKVELEHIDPGEGSYNLSREDRSVIVLAQILPELSIFTIDDPDDVALSTTDRRLREFAERKFEIVNIEPLDVLNSWLEAGIWRYDDQQHDSILQEWADHEPEPSIAAKRRFKKLTGQAFPNSNSGRTQ